MKEISPAMKAFISGGAGFIGSHLVHRLLGEKTTESVVVYDNFTSGKRSFLDFAQSDSRLRIIEGDLKKVEDVVAAMKGCDTVFHLAANPDIAKAVTQTDIDFWEGTYLTQNVVEGM